MLLSVRTASSRVCIEVCDKEAVGALPLLLLLRSELVSVAVGDEESKGSRLAEAAPAEPGTVNGDAMRRTARPGVWPADNVSVDSNGSSPARTNETQGTRTT